MHPSKRAEAITGGLLQILTKLREERGLSKNETAVRSGLSVSFISEMESGKKRPSVETLLRLAAVFDLRGSEILAKAEEEFQKKQV